MSRLRRDADEILPDRHQIVHNSLCALVAEIPNIQMQLGRFSEQAKRVAQTTADDWSTKIAIEDATAALLARILTVTTQLLGQQAIASALKQFGFGALMTYLASAGVVVSLQLEWPDLDQLPEFPEQLRLDFGVDRVAMGAAAHPCDGSLVPSIEDCLLRRAK